MYMHAHTNIIQAPRTTNHSHTIPFAVLSSRYNGKPNLKKNPSINSSFTFYTKLASPAKKNFAKPKLSLSITQRMTDPHPGRPWTQTPGASPCISEPARDVEQPPPALCSDVSTRTKSTLVTTVWDQEVSIIVPYFINKEARGLMAKLRAFPRCKHLPVRCSDHLNQDRINLNQGV